MDRHRRLNIVIALLLAGVARAETGEQACEGKGLDEAACSEVGCCHYADGQCWYDGDGDDCWTGTTDEEPMDPPLAMGIGLFGAIFSGVAILANAGALRRKKQLKQLMAADGVGSVVAAISRTAVEHHESGEGGSSTTYYVWYAWTAQRANSGAFFRVTVNKQSIPGTTHSKLQQGMQLPVRFLEAEPRRCMLQVAAEDEMRALDGGGAMCCLMCISGTFCVVGCAVGLLLTLALGVEGGEIAGPGVYLFIMLLVLVGAWRCTSSTENNPLPCCPEFGCGCAGNTIVLEELAPGQVQNGSMQIARLPVAVVTAASAAGNPNQLAVATTVSMQPGMQQQQMMMMQPGMQQQQQQMVMMQPGMQQQQMVMMQPGMQQQQMPMAQPGGAQTMPMAMPMAQPNAMTIPGQPIQSMAR